MAVKVIRKFRLLFDVVWGSPNDGDVPIYDQAQDKLVMGPQTGGGGGGAPTTVDYLVGTASGSLSNEIPVGATPGGELGGTWDTPTVDAVHSGSSHAAVQAAAEATAAAALAGHEADTSNVHGIADTTVLATDAEVAAAVAASEAGQVRDGDAAGGVLSGTYPNPGFAVDMATQAELDAHISDATDAHAGSAITNTPAGNIAATTIQAAINELDSEKAATASAVMDGDAAGGVLAGTYPNPSFASDMATQAELDAHLNDTSDAHDASAISILDAANDFTATDVEGALAELQSDHETDEAALAAHLADTTDAHDASAISVLDTNGDYTATDVEGVLAEIAGQLGGGGGAKVVPIDLTTPRTTSLSGNAFWSVVGLTDWDAGHWEFVKDVEGKVYGLCRVPADYASGATIRLEIAANATSGVTRLQLGLKAVADGETMNPTLTDETAQDITVPGTAYFRKQVSFSSLTETIAASDLLIVEVFHDGDHANDTLAVNTLLFGAWFEYTA